MLVLSNWQLAKLCTVSACPSVTDYTLRKKLMSANAQGVFAETGRAHCQRQVAFFILTSKLFGPKPPTVRIVRFIGRSLMTASK